MANGGALGIDAIAVAAAMLAVLIPPLIELVPFLEASPGLLVSLVTPPALTSTCGYVLTFFPPRRYQRWITEKARGGSGVR